MTRRKRQQLLDQNVDANAPQNISLTLRKEFSTKKYIYITELRMEDETIIENGAQILDATENYFNNSYTSACSATQDDY